MRVEEVSWRERSVERAPPFGCPARNPVYWEEVPAKVRDCFHRALPEGHTERVLEMLASLKSVDDVGELMGVGADRGKQKMSGTTVL